MSKKREMFENVITSAFSNSAFVDFSKEFFTGLQLVAPNMQNKVYSSYNNYVEHYCHIGNYEGKDGEKVAVLAVCLKNEDMVNRSRGIQRNFVKQLMDSGNCAGAFVAFYTYGDLTKWRLSFVRLDYEFSKGKISEKLTPAKRFSYLVGDKEPCHTAMERLFPIFEDDNTNPGLDELEEAFSVEKVTKEFYEHYKTKYLALKEYLESNEQFMMEAEFRGFTSEQFAKKLMGQIVFLYFIQKKGWLGVNAIPVILNEKDYKNAMFSKGQKSRAIFPSIYEPDGTGFYRLNFTKFQALSDDDETIAANCVKGRPWGTGPKDFMRQIFKACEETGKNYFDDYLEPLFYSALNKNRGENAYFPPLHRRIPFLNGGLFEQLDNYDWENNDFDIPNDIFSNESTKGKRDADGILDIFDRYNFTMNEDEPLECEVAIDPEMLGKVFENLLDVKDRKSKGAFYTPREIVHYMCQETLINYLVTKTNIDEEDIRDFILYGDLMKDEDTTKDAREGNKEMLISESIYSMKSGVNRIKEIDDLLANVKVADLAVGSGAFPLGMLNEIVRARETLTAYMAIGANGFDKKILYSERKPYFLKVNTIKNCIFACDIEPSAVDISKLRLWLSIVIDDELVEKVTNNGMFDEHTKPRQLPNLDCNIICGNSLIDEFKGNTLISESALLNNIGEGTQLSIFQSGVDTLLSELIMLQDKLFFVKEHNEKEEVKERIKGLYDQIILEQGIKNDPELAEAYYEASRGASLPFVIWQLYFPAVFRDNGGFDIVIGNPPYGAELSDEVKKYCVKRYSDVHIRTIDTFNFFISLSFQLINKTGRVSFIIPNNLLFQAEFEKTRVLLLSHHLLDVINLGDGVFNSASVPTCIYVMNNEFKDNYEFNYSDFRSKEVNDIVWTKKDMKISSSDVLISSGKIIGISSESKTIIDKIMKKSALLDTLVLDASYGVTTGCDKAFIVDSETVKKENLEVDYLHTTISGRDINRYVLLNDNKILIYMPKTEGNDNSDNIQKHLNQYREKLDNVSEVKKGIRPWWSNHRARSKELFLGEKIVLRQTGDTIIATYDDRGIYSLDSIMNIKLKDNIDYKFILGCLNSSYFNYLYQNRTQESGRGFAQVKPQNVRALPIPLLNKEVEKKIIDAVNMALRLKTDDVDSDISLIMESIDNILFEFYDLTEKEIDIIKGVE